ncbi:TIGR01777 family oxidoreductase [Ornithinibacillus californiensis]|uniref:TIGR01777 family oxidoreductase n=1 Tax=Ornithinibacillus californiensis TaxID=161536 RepID=UPI00064DA08D|nr:TIGR01777 family oxidoreductase [Ornithinibacillus californiensis]
MNLLITGGTGFVGKKLVKKLTSLEYHTYILTRTPKEFSNTEYTSYITFDDIQSLPAIHGVINLAGESLFGYWTKEKKERIKSSRLEITQKLIDLLTNLNQKPEVFISGSAVGFYGISDEVIFTEETEKPGNDFLADVVVEWEKTAKQAEELNVRTVFARFGVILGREGGALPLMSLPTKLFVGGRVGKGEQWTSWIHIDDVVDLILFALQNKNISGPLNVTSPHPVRNKEFNQILAKTLRRPYWFPTPGPLVRMVTGEMSQLVLKGQYVMPNKALDYGFTFNYPTLEMALNQVFSRVKKN